MIEEIVLGGNSQETNIVLNNSQKVIINNVFNDNAEVSIGGYREFAFFGGVRAGKSFCYQLIGYLLANKYPNSRLLWIRDTLPELQSSVIKQFRDDFEKYGTFEYVDSKRTAKFTNGSTIMFSSFDNDGTSLLSSELDAIFFCQADGIPEPIFLTALSRLSGQRCIKPMMFCEGNPSNNWTKTRYKDKTKEELNQMGICFVNVTAEENLKNLPADYITYLKNNYPKNWYERMVMGNWENIDEMVFSEFREQQHVISPHKIPDTAKKRQGMDYGWRNPTALLWGYIDYDGILCIYSEDGGPELTAPEIAKKALALGKNVIVCDYSIKRPDRDGRSLWDDLVKAGLWLQESNKQELANIQLANQLLKTGRLKIMANCVELIKEMKNYKWKRLKVGKESNLPEETIDKDNHYIDALLYMIASLEELKIESPEQKAFKNTMQYAIIKKSKNNDIMRFG